VAIRIEKAAVTRLINIPVRAVLLFRDALLIQFQPRITVKHSGISCAISRLFWVAITLLAFILATPRMASAYVDPGSGAMIWQIVAAAFIGSMFYARRGVSWIRARLGLGSGRSKAEPATERTPPRG
jgi:hypothetical protein